MAGVTSDPSVSVIVPVYNDPSGIRQTLDSLTDQTFPNDDYEVIAVDNNSTDDTRSIIERFETDYENIYLEVEEEIQGSYAARNAGIRRAAGEVIGFLDADVTVPEDWLVRGVAVLEGRNADYLACDVNLVGSDGPDGYAARYDRQTGFPIEKYVDVLSFAPTCCLFVRYSVFEDLGPFDERLVSGGDLEFGNRVEESGRTLHYVEDLTANHPVRSTIAALGSKAARVGRGRYQLRSYYPDRYGMPWRMLVNPLTYTPPIPWRAPGAFDGFGTLSRRDQLIMYLLLTVTKFARAYGKLAQAAEMGREPLLGPGQDSGDRQNTRSVPGTFEGADEPS